MGELNFTGYRAYAAGPDDPLRAKWDGVRSSLALTADAAARFAGLSLPALNVSVNRRILYQADPEGQDIWQTPMGTYRLGTGDCEDFAILKYALLTMASIPVRLVVGEIKKLGMGNLNGNRPHAWVAGFIANEWHAFDQMFDQLIPVSEYINWCPLAAMHDDQVVRFGQEFTINEILNRAKKV